jgi:hypothetical protein
MNETDDLVIELFYDPEKEYFWCEKELQCTHCRKIIGGLDIILESIIGEKLGEIITHISLSVRCVDCEANLRDEIKDEKRESVG